MSQSDKHSFFFNSVHLTPEEQIGQHEQSTWELSYILVGSGVRLIGGTKEPFQSGEVVLIPPGIPHCWCFGNNVTDTRGRIANITVTFGTDFLDNCATVFPELCGHIEELKKKSDAVKFGKGKAAVIAGILENMRDLDDSGRVAPMINLLLLLAGNGMESVVGRHQKIDKEKNRLNQIQVYVVCNVKRDITLDDVARHVGMNRASFCVFFKKVTGKTFCHLSQ